MPAGALPEGRPGPAKDAAPNRPNESPFTCHDATKCFRVGHRVRHYGTAREQEVNPSLPLTSTEPPHDSPLYDARDGA